MQLTSALLSFLLLSLTIVPARAQNIGGDAKSKTATTPTTAQTQPAVAPQPATAKTGTARPVARGPQQIVREGTSIEFQMSPIGTTGDKGSAPEIMEGEDATITFRVSDTTTKTPVTGLNLSAWMSLRQATGAPTEKDCKEKVQSYLQGSLRTRPDVDLNSYFLLALNKEANISVIDPLLGFGGSKLLTLVMLRSPGEDWALNGNRKKLFVSLPFVNEVAVVNTDTWKVMTSLTTGNKPTRIALQPDEKYLWVGNDGVTGAEPSGVTVIDTTDLRSVKEIPTGAGHHEIAFSPDNRYAFVTNEHDATLSVIDVQTLVKLKDIKTGARPSSVAFSPLSKAIYVSSTTDGSVTVIDSRSHQTLTRMQTKPGARAVRFVPDGRYGFVVNPQADNVYIFDASINKLLHTVTLGKSPDQVTFTKAFAYVRSAGTEEVHMIRLSTVGKQLDVTHFPGGQLAPETAQTKSFADIIYPAPEGNSVLVANPADKVIYYYTEGMAAPMGNFQNYKREPRSVMIVDRSLRETVPGLYTTTIKVPRSGIYDIAFLSDSPRVVHCFEAAADVNPTLQKERQVALRIEYMMKDQKMRAGENFKIRFKLFDAMTNKPKDGLKDVRVLTFLAPGTWQKRDFAKSLGEGVYEVSVTPPEAGVYMIFVESQSQGVPFRKLPHVTFQAGEAASTTTPAAAATPAKP
jgi:YVTN family beta-propeller protein